MSKLLARFMRTRGHARSSSMERTRPRTNTLDPVDISTREILPARRIAEPTRMRSLDDSDLELSEHEFDIPNDAARTPMYKGVNPRFAYLELKVFLLELEEIVGEKNNDDDNLGGSGTISSPSDAQSPKRRTSDDSGGNVLVVTDLEIIGRNLLALAPSELTRSSLITVVETLVQSKADKLKGHAVYCHARKLLQLVARVRRNLPAFSMAVRDNKNICSSNQDVPFDTLSGYARHKSMGGRPRRSSIHPDAMRHSGDRSLWEVSSFSEAVEVFCGLNVVNTTQSHNLDGVYQMKPPVATPLAKPVQALREKPQLSKQGSNESFFSDDSSRISVSLTRERRRTMKKRMSAANIYETPGVYESEEAKSLRRWATMTVTPVDSSGEWPDSPDSGTPTGSDAVQMVMCRICEEMVPVNTFQQHTDACTMASIYEMKVVGIDQQIRANRNDVHDESRKRKKKMRRAYSVYYDASGETPSHKPKLTSSTSSLPQHADVTGLRQRAGTVSTSSPNRVRFRDDSPGGPPRTMSGGRVIRPSPLTGSGSPNMSKQRSSGSLLSLLTRSRASKARKETDDDATPLSRVVTGRSWSASHERPYGLNASSSVSDLHAPGDAKDTALCDANTDMFEGRLILIADEALECSDINEQSVSRCSKLLDRLRELSADAKIFDCSRDTLNVKINLFQKLIAQKLQALLSVDAAADSDIWATKARVAGGSNRSARSVSTTASEQALPRRKPSEPTISLLIPTIHDFEVLKPISKGAYATVHLSRKKRTGDLYAMKVMPKALIATKNMIDTARVERNLMARSAQCPFVVRLFYTFETESHLFLVMEFMPGGDLFTLLRNMVALPEASAKQYIVECVLALEWLHSRNIIHRDLKPDNMLIGVNGHMKLTDFGLSKEEVDRTRSVLTLRATGVSEIKEADDGGMKKKVGTPDYLAPETLTGSDHGPVVDWWSLGAIAYELMYGIPPFHGPTPEAVFRNILMHKLQFPPQEEGEEGVSSEANDLIAQLLIADPARRLGANGATEVMKHPWFTDIDWSRVLEQDPPFVPDLDDELDTDYFDSKGAAMFSISDVLPRGREDSEEQQEEAVGVGTWGVVEDEGDEVIIGAVSSSPPGDNAFDDDKFAELIDDESNSRDISPNQSESSSSSDDASRRRREVADLGYGFASLASLTVLNEGVAREAARLRAHQSATRSDDFYLPSGRKALDDIDSDLLRRRWQHQSLPMEIPPMDIPDTSTESTSSVDALLPPRPAVPPEISPLLRKVIDPTSRLDNRRRSSPGRNLRRWPTSPAVHKPPSVTSDSSSSMDSPHKPRLSPIAEEASVPQKARQPARKPMPHRREVRSMVRHASVAALPGARSLGVAQEDKKIKSNPTTPQQQKRGKKSKKKAK